MTDFGRRSGDMFKADYDPDEDGLVTAAELHALSHETGRADEISVAGLVGRVNYVDRGDINPVDFTQVTLTTDAGWEDLDLSSIVPAGAQVVHLAGLIRDDQISQYLQFKKKGNNFNNNTLYQRTQVANIAAYFNGFVTMDTDRKIQYRGSNTTFTEINITIAGWLI